jgi:hypothetical protein
MSKLGYTHCILLFIIRLANIQFNLVVLPLHYSFPTLPKDNRTCYWQGVKDIVILFYHIQQRSESFETKMGVINFQHPL